MPYKVPSNRDHEMGSRIVRSPPKTLTWQGQARVLWLSLLFSTFATYVCPYRDKTALLVAAQYSFLIATYLIEVY